MAYTTVKFQSNQSQTIGAVANTMYLLLERGLKDKWTEKWIKGRKAENYVPSLFFKKAGDNKVISYNFQKILFAFSED